MICVKCHQEVPDMPFCGLCGHQQGKPIRSTYKRGNGQGTAIKRGKTWTGFKTGYSTVIESEDGTKRIKRIRPSKGGFKTKKEALTWACAGSETEIPVPKLSELWEGYKANDLLKLSETKQTAYKIARNRIEPIISRRIDTLTVDDLQNVINEKCNSYYTARDVKNLLSHLYKRAMASNANQGKVTQNLSEFLVLPSLNEKEAVPFSSEEVKKLWTAYESGDNVAAYILLMCYTGMMPGELLKCSRDMVDMTAHEIRGAGAKTKVRKKAAIAFPDFMEPVVQDMMTWDSKNSQAKNDRLVNMNKDNFYKAFYETVDRAGIENNPHRLTPYSCRHTFGTEAVKAGFHPAVIQKMLRHSNTKMQEKYTHLGNEEVHDAVNKMTAPGEANQ